MPGRAADQRRSLRGRVLKSLPTVPGLRPTGARVREAIFDRLQHELRDAVVLDLFAGSGALAFEALSRGASRATLVEQHAAVARHLQAQIRELALGERAHLWHGDAATFLRRHSARAGASELAGPYDLVFIDPPYDDTEAVLAAVLPALIAGGWLAESAALVCEYDRAGGRRPPAWPQGLVVETTRHYGQTAVEFLRHTKDYDHGGPQQC
ncbi:16S rRNA (guanine(966)-N(2))-methyltransferase RsmD [Nannocystis pusilla]|uniref:16S rRNA (guanine(966)-N(2))-methyltransferase RsmD n=1 Tax=Nannocystis pusilla TaxID=889268 RepID=UPI003B7986FD